MVKSVQEFISEFNETLSDNKNDIIKVEQDIETIKKMIDKIKNVISALDPKAGKIPKKLKEFLKLIRNLQMETKQYKNIINALRIKFDDAINSVSKIK